MKSEMELLSEIAVIVEEYSNNELVINKLMKTYKDKKLTIRTVGGIFKGLIPIESLLEDENELCLWAIDLYETTHKEEVNPQEYFSDKAIANAKTYVSKNIMEYSTDSIVLHNVDRYELVSGKYQYVCSNCSYYDLVRFTDNKLITYDTNMQRELTYRKYKDKIIKTVTLNKKSVKQISELISKDKFFRNLLTLNITRDEFETEGVIYDEDSRILTLTPNFAKGIFINIIDGYHRAVSCSKGVSMARSEGRELKGGFMISVFECSAQEAQNYIDIQNQQNKFNSEQTKAFRDDDYNTFVRALNTNGSSSTNKMNNMVCNTFEEREIYNKYCTVGTLHDAFKLTGLKFDEPFMNKKYLKHYIEMFNDILGYYLYKYNNNVQVIKNKTISLENNIFVGYVAIATELMEMANKEDILMNILEKIDLNREQSVWEEIDMFKKSPKTYKKIYNYFEKIAKEFI